MRAFVTGLVAALTLVVAVAVLGVVYSSSWLDQRDSGVASALVASRLADSGVQFMRGSLEDAALDSAFNSGCTADDFCSVFLAKHRDYQASSLSFLSNGEAFLNKISEGFSACNQIQATGGFDSSYNVFSAGNYLLWIGNSSFAHAKKTIAFAFNWTIDVRNSTQLTAELRDSSGLFRTVNASCPAFFSATPTPIPSSSPSPFPSPSTSPTPTPSPTPTASLSPSPSPAASPTASPSPSPSPSASPLPPTGFCDQGSGGLGNICIVSTSKTLSTNATFGTLVVNNSAVLSIGAYVVINATTVTVASGAVLSADGKGYPGGSPGNKGNGVGGGSPPSPGYGDASGGGGYGGPGGAGAGQIGSSGGIAYGYLSQPTDYGSGGGGAYSGSTTPGGNGGGLVWIIASGTVNASGTISANGSAGDSAGSYGGSGGGSGGSIFIQSAKLVGDGFLAAAGGAGGGACAGACTGVWPYGGGGGAGGRISLVFTSSSFTGSLNANGGAGGLANVQGKSGSVGSTYTS